MSRQTTLKPPKTIDISSEKPVIVSELGSLEKLSKLLDAAFQVPGTNISLGLDSVLGVIPVVGDAIGGMLSSYIVYESARLGIPKLILLRMIGNVALDSLIGAIPILGDLFDMTFKANLRNLNLVREHLPSTTGGRDPAQIARLVNFAIGSLLLMFLVAGAALAYVFANVMRL